MRQRNRCQSPAFAQPRNPNAKTLAASKYHMFLLFSFGFLLLMGPTVYRFLSPATMVPSHPTPRNEIANAATNNAITLWLTTWNVAGLVFSQRAPSTWTQNDQVGAVKTQLLASHPDVLALQECPNSDWAYHEFGTDYQWLGSTRSHAGYVSLLVRRNFTAKTMRLQGLPIVAATLELGDRTVVIASVHLAPFIEGSDERADQMEELQTAATTAKADALLFLGDTNMRDAEDDEVENDLGLTDVWKVAGASDHNRYSWDTLAHDSWQNLFYADTRPYQQRYDRIYFWNAGKETSNMLEVSSFALIGNEPVAPSKHHFLSDHFGIAATITLEVE